MADDDILIIETAEGAVVELAPCGDGLRMSVDTLNSVASRVVILREQVIKELARYVVGYLAKQEAERQRFNRPHGAC